MSALVLVARRVRFAVCAIASAATLAVCLVPGAVAAGSGGWDHLGDGATPGTASLNGAVLRACPKRCAYTVRAR